MFLELFLFEVKQLPSERNKKT